MKEDQIREVMWLVRQYGDKNYLQGGADAQDRELSSKNLDDEIRGKVLAIDTKLRELLPEWLPIESAPVNKTLMLGFKNKLGNWRSTRGCWMDEVEIASWEHDESPVGWYETPSEGEECFYIDPTHWMPLPKAPG